MARIAGFALRASSMAVLNCTMKCLVVVDSIVNHQPGMLPSPPTLAPVKGPQSAQRLEFEEFGPSSVTRTNAQNALTAKLHSHQAERLVSTGHQCKVCSAKDVRRKCCKFGSRENPSFIYFHHAVELHGCEFSIKVNYGTNTYQLNIGMSLHY